MRAFAEKAFVFVFVFFIVMLSVIPWHLIKPDVCVLWEGVCMCICIFHFHDLCNSSLPNACFLREGLFFVFVLFNFMTYLIPLYLIKPDVISMIFVIPLYLMSAFSRKVFVSDLSICIFMIFVFPLT